MPKPTAIKLSQNNIPLISYILNIDERKLNDELTGNSPVYIVTNPRLFNGVVPYLIYQEEEFLRDFASVPPGIEDRFVPVTQVKD